MTVPSPRILNVDDDEAGRYAVSRQLKQSGYEMIEAETGARGIELAQDTEPDLILLDVRLPDIDGFEVCRRLKENPATSGIPIIQISASYIDASSRVKGLSNGADAYLVEPADPAVLAATIHSLLRMKSAEASVRRDARQWRDTFNAIQDGVALLDSSGNALRNNHAYVALLQASQASLEAIIAERLVKVRQSRKREAVQEELDHKTLFIKLDPVFTETGEFDGAVCTIADVTERMRFEQQMRHTQKLESLGVLAGGIAHDFNNLLTGILGNASLMLETLNPASLEFEAATGILRAGESAADLTRQILAYSGKSSMMTRNLSVSGVVLAVRSMIRRLIPKNVDLLFDMTPGLPDVYGDVGQIQQIAMNLIINAAESFEPGVSGKILVRTDCVELEPDFRHIGEDPVVPGRYVTFVVADNGCGMDEATQARIFDPFFSTKFTGRGLGLSAVHGILRGHKGYLHLKSKPGEGTTFEVYFPVSSVVDSSKEKQAANVRKAQGGTVLVVDDEMSVRNLARNAFEKHGYKVLTAENGKSGVEVFERRHREIDLVLLDLAMPVLDGEDALESIQVISPSVPVILSSGYGESSPTRKFRDDLIAGYLPKPYTVSELLAISERVIGRKHSDG